MIFAIAIDPFAQQLARYYTCSQIVQGSEATIPRTNFYDDSGGYFDGLSDKTVSVTMQAAFNAGIFSPGGNRVVPDCETGNCTFSKPYKTIAYCSTCTDITLQLIKTTYNATYDLGNVTIANYTLPSSLRISSLLPTYERESFVMGADSNSNTIQAIMATSPLPLTCSAEWPWGCTGVGAAECRFDMCIRTFTGSVQAGNFTEIEITSNQDTWLNSNQSIWESFVYISTVDLTCLNDTEKGILKMAGYEFSNEAQWLPYNVCVVPGAAINASGYGWLPINYTGTDIINASCIYSATPPAVNSMIGLFYNAFFNQQPILGSYGGPESTSETIANIFNNGNVSARTIASNFQRITDSMTTNIRTHADSHSPNYATGIVFQSDTCITAEWGWLAFPTILLLLTIVFFATVVIQTRTRDAMISGSQNYKKSALPLLFHGLEESTAMRFG